MKTGRQEDRKTGKQEDRKTEENEDKGLWFSCELNTY